MSEGVQGSWGSLSCTVQNWEDNQAELPKEKEWVQRHGNMVSSQKINAEYKSKNPRMSHSTAQCMFKSNKPGWVNNIEIYHPTEWPWMLYFYPTKHTPIYDNSVEHKKLQSAPAIPDPVIPDPLLYRTH